MKKISVMANVMGDEENFNEVLYSIQSLNVASNFNQTDHTSSINYLTSELCSEVDHDRPKFDSIQAESVLQGGHPPVASNHLMSAKICDENTNERLDQPSMNFNGRENHRESKEMTQIKVNVGIDEDLRMILEMDPSLMDEGVEASSVNNVVECPKVIKLPPRV